MVIQNLVYVGTHRFPKKQFISHTIRKKKNSHFKRGLVMVPKGSTKPLERFCVRALFYKTILRRFRPLVLTNNLYAYTCSRASSIILRKLSTIQTSKSQQLAPSIHYLRAGLVLSDDNFPKWLGKDDLELWAEVCGDVAEPAPRHQVFDCSSSSSYPISALLLLRWAGDVDPQLGRSG